MRSDAASPAAIAPSRPTAADGSAVRRAMGWTAVFAITWAVLELILGGLLHGRYDLLEIVWLRYAVHLLIVLAIWGALRPRPFWRTRRPVFHLCRSLLMLLMPGAFAAALAVGSPPDFVWSIFWVAPPLIVLAAALSLRERPPAPVMAATALAAFAAAAVFGHARPPSAGALGLAVLVAGSFGLYVVMTRSLHGEMLAVNMFYTAAAVFALLSCAMPFVWRWPDAHDAAILAMIGVVGFGGLYALDEACRAAPAWACASALGVHAVGVAAILAAAEGHLPGLRVLAASATILIVFAGLWICANRMAGAGIAAPTWPKEAA